MLQYEFGRTESGNPIGIVHAHLQTDPIGLMRALKASYPDVWAQVNMEIIVPAEAKAGPVNRILNANGG